MKIEVIRHDTGLSELQVIELAPVARLEAKAKYDLFANTGRAWSRIASFVTGTEADELPPAMVLKRATFEPADRAGELGPCSFHPAYVRLEIEHSEDTALFGVWNTDEGAMTVAMAAHGGFEIGRGDYCAVSNYEFEKGKPARVIVRALDLAGNRSEPETIGLAYPQEARHVALRSVEQPSSEDDYRCRIGGNWEACRPELASVVVILTAILCVTLRRRRNRADRHDMPEKK